MTTIGTLSALDVAVLLAAVLIVVLGPDGGQPVDRRQPLLNRVRDCGSGAHPHQKTGPRLQGAGLTDLVRSHLILSTRTRYPLSGAGGSFYVPGYDCRHERERLLAGTRRNPGGAE